MLHYDVIIKWRAEYIAATQLCYVSNELVLLHTRGLPTFLSVVAEMIYGKCKFVSMKTYFSSEIVPASDAT